MEDKNWRKHPGKTFGQTLALVRFFGFFFPSLQRDTLSLFLGREQSLWTQHCVAFGFSLPHQSRTGPFCRSARISSGQLACPSATVGEHAGGEKKTLGKQKNRRANLCRRIASWLV